MSAPKDQDVTQKQVNRWGRGGIWETGGQATERDSGFIRNPTGGSFTCQLYFPMLDPLDANRIDRHLCEAALVIYGPWISSGGRGVERAKFSRNTLHSAGADAKLAGNFEDALTGP